MEADFLTELRGLHQPPLDLGTMIADAAIALALGLLCAWLIAQGIKMTTTRRVSLERAALRRLADVGSDNDREGLKKRAHVLQDFAKALPDREGDWLERLDEHLGGFFSNGAGKNLRDALYQPGAAFNFQQFDTELKASIERVDR